MLLTLRQNEYLNDRAGDIISQIHKHKKVGLWASMGVGKTEFFKKALREYAKKNDLVLVMVNPSVGQIEQIGESDPNIGTVCQGKTYYGEEVVITTPESLYKVIGTLQEDNKKFILVYDEAHEKVVSVNFRPKFGIVDRYESLAEKVIYMTATPEPLFDETFDLVIDVDKQDNATVKCNLLQVDKVNVSTILARIEKSMLSGEKVILCHDNKAENKKILSKLIERYGKDYIMAIEDNQPVQEDLFDTDNKSWVKAQAFDLVSSQDRNGKAYNEIIKNKFPEGLKILITTSFIKAGLNIDNPDNTRLILTVNARNFMVTDKVQQMGRLRNREGIAGIDVIIPKVQAPKTSKAYIPVETIAERIRVEVTDHFKQAVEDTEIPSKSALEYTCATYDQEQEKYVINENKLRNRIYSDYCWSLLIYQDRLKIELERQKAIKLKVEITELNQEQDEQLEAELKEDKKAQKEDHAEACEKLKQLNELSQEVVIEIPIDEIQLLDNDLKPIAESYRLKMPDSKKKLINQVRHELCEGDKVKAHLKVLLEDKKDIQRELDQVEVIKLNNEFNRIKNQSVAIEKGIRRYKKTLAGRVYFIRHNLQDLEAKRGRLTQKVVNELAQLMIDQEYYKGKKINLTKAGEMLQQDLQLIYNIRTDAKGSRISSLKI